MKPFLSFILLKQSFEGKFFYLRSCRQILKVEQNRFLCEILYRRFLEIFTAWKVSKYETFSGMYFPVFGLNTERYGPNAGKYGPEKPPHFGTFHAVFLTQLSKSPFMREDWTLNFNCKHFRVFVGNS